MKPLTTPPVRTSLFLLLLSLCAVSLLGSATLSSGVGSLSSGTQKQAAAKTTAVDEQVRYSVGTTVPDGNVVGEGAVKFKGEALLSLRNIDKKRGFVVLNFDGSGQPKVQTYTLNPINGGVFDRQFSPDGKYIFFKVGDSASVYNPYKLYVLDRKTKVVRLVTPRSLIYRRVIYSPDGRYIAYVTGGEWQGVTGPYGDSLRLFVCDWKNNKEHFVIENDSLRNSFTWAAHNHLVYGVVPDYNKVGFKPSQIPNLYEYSISTGKSRLIVKDAHRPVVSPDGKKVAFFGNENPQKPFPLQSYWLDDPGNRALCVSNLDGTQRKALNREKDAFPVLLWRPDNLNIISVKEVQHSPAARALVREWDTTTGKFRDIVALSAKDLIQLNRPELYPQFAPVSVSSDGSHLFMTIEEAIRPVPKINAYQNATKLEAIELATGKVHALLTSTKSSIGWHD